MWWSVKEGGGVARHMVIGSRGKGAVISGGEKSF